MSSLQVGAKAPDFTLPDTDRKQRSLGEFKGKNVVLAFFPGAFTGGCSKEACALRDSASKLQGLNAQIVGVSVDSPFAQKGWADVNKLAFPLLSDYKREVVKKYGTALDNFAGLEGYTSTKRAVFVLDKDQVVRYAWVSDPPSEPNYEEINAALSKLKK